MHCFNICVLRQVIPRPFTVAGPKFMCCDNYRISWAFELTVETMQKTSFHIFKIKFSYIILFYVAQLSSTATNWKVYICFVRVLFFYFVLVCLLVEKRLVGCILFKYFSRLILFKNVLKHFLINDTGYSSFFKNYNSL